MIADWIAAGAAFGIKAFFAVVVFGLLVLLGLSFVSMLVRALGGYDETKNKDNWPE